MTNILHVVSWAVIEALRIAVMGSAFIAVIVIAMLGGQYLLVTMLKESDHCLRNWKASGRK